MAALNISLLHQNAAAFQRCDAFLIKMKNVEMFESPRSGRRMAYNFTPGKPGYPTKIMIHGLGDDMSHVEGLARLALADGYSVLRVDLHGHGATLTDYIELHKELPLRFDYEENIQDISDLVENLGLRDISIIGHSYGGGIAFGLTLELLARKDNINIRSVHMLAPYVQRIDKFLREYLTSPMYMSLVVDDTTESLVPKPFSSIMSPLVNFVKNMFASVQLLHDALDRMIRVDQNFDAVMDPVLDGLLRQAYRSYFISGTGKRGIDLTDSEREEISLKVEAALKVTKGIRSFDLLNETVSFPDNLPPIQIIGGSKDRLVLPTQLQLFAARLQNSKKKFKLVSLRGAGHLFPRERPEETYAAINGFLPKPRSKSIEKIRNGLMSTTGLSPLKR